MKSEKEVVELFSGKDVVVIGNAISLNRNRLNAITENKENLITCAFNKGVERFKPDVAFLAVADWWNSRIDVRDSLTIHCSPVQRPSLTADYTIPLNTIETLKKIADVKRPSSGFIANAFLCQSRLKIKSVTLIGFDFKATPTYYDKRIIRENEPHDYNKEAFFTQDFFVLKKKYKIIK
jgi:hypothetical protein